jgi:hypothetical protein
MDNTLASNALTASLLRANSPIPNTATWKQTPYNDGPEVLVPLRIRIQNMAYEGWGEAGNA